MHIMNADAKIEPNENFIIKCTIPEIKNSLHRIIEDWERRQWTW